MFIGDGNNNRKITPYLEVDVNTCVCLAFTAFVQSTVTSLLCNQLKSGSELRLQARRPKVQPVTGLRHRTPRGRCQTVCGAMVEMWVERKIAETQGVRVISSVHGYFISTPFWRHLALNSGLHNGEWYSLMTCKAYGDILHCRYIRGIMFYLPDIKWEILRNPRLL